MLNFTYTIENHPDGKCFIGICHFFNYNFSMDIKQCNLYSYLLIFHNSLSENINSTTIKYLELWGNVESDGKWNGLVRLAKDGTVDFVMCDLMHTYSRSQVKIYTATRI